MTSRRSWLDRLLALASPRVVADHAPPIREHAPGVWTVERRLKMPGGPSLPTNATVLGLESGGLVVIAPPAMSESAGIEALGPVDSVVVPNSFHHLFVSECMARHPGARLIGPPGLVDRVAGLPPLEEFEAGTKGPWPGEIEFAVLGPVRQVCEIALFHLRSRTLVLTDVAFNLRKIERPLDRVFWRLVGVGSSFGPTFDSRMLLLRDRAAASRFVSEVARWPMERIIVAHGDVLEENAKAEFLRAFRAYLPEEDVT